MHGIGNWKWNGVGKWNSEMEMEGIHDTSNKYTIYPNSLLQQTKCTKLFQQNTLHLHCKMFISKRTQLSG